MFLNHLLIPNVEVHPLPLGLGTAGPKRTFVQGDFGGGIPATSFFTYAWRQKWVDECL